MLKTYGLHCPKKAVTLKKLSVKKWPQSRRCQQPTVEGLSGEGSLLWLVDSNLSLNFKNEENTYMYFLPPPCPYLCIYDNSIFPKAHKVILFTLLISIYFVDHCDLQIFFAQFAQNRSSLSVLLLLPYLSLLIQFLSNCYLTFNSVLFNMFSSDNLTTLHCYFIMVSYSITVA